MHVAEARDEQRTAVRALLERSFPPAQLGAGVGLDPGPAGQIRVAVEEPDGTVLGCALLRGLTPDAVALDYLAVDPDVRARGTGRALLADAVARAREAGADWLVCEVEPAEAPAHPRYGDPARRMAFYTRAGAVAVASGYAILDRSGAADALLEMELLAVPTGADPAPPSAEQVQAWVRALWGPGGYDVGPDDPLLARVLERIRVRSGPAGRG